MKEDVGACGCKIPCQAKVQMSDIKTSDRRGHANCRPKPDMTGCLVDLLLTYFLWDTVCDKSLHTLKLEVRNRRQGATDRCICHLINLYEHPSARAHTMQGWRSNSTPPMSCITPAVVVQNTSQSSQPPGPYHPLSQRRPSCPKTVSNGTNRVQDQNRNRRKGTVKIRNKTANLVKVRNWNRWCPFTTRL